MFFLEDMGNVEFQRLSPEWLRRNFSDLLVRPVVFDNERMNVTFNSLEVPLIQNERTVGYIVGAEKKEDGRGRRAESLCLQIGRKLELKTGEFWPSGEITRTIIFDTGLKEIGPGERTEFIYLPRFMQGYGMPVPARFIFLVNPLFLMELKHIKN